MRKKVFMFGILIFFLILILPAIFAANDTSTNTESSKIDKAYSCLENKVGDNCKDLSSEEKVFSLLAIGKCKDEVLNDINFESDIKFTAQALLALDKSGSSTSDVEKWLLNQNKSTSGDIVWYLQVDSVKKSQCDVSYEGSSYKIVIDSDKKINSNAGNCLSRAKDNYWLEVAPNCYGSEFEISCNESFSTNLLYKKKTSATIYVSEETHSATSDARTKEKVESLCFKKSNDCDYESSLWASFVLDYLGYNKSSYIPYLVSMADESENKIYLPESFLYFLTDSSDFRNSLLQKQKPAGYWLESSDKYYDTAIALHPMQDESSQEKSTSKSWLLEVQGDDGCWNNGNLLNTAFLLYSVWPRISSVSGNAGLDCRLDGSGYCLSKANCGGNILEEFSCAGSYICCDTAKKEVSCSNDLGGYICNSNEICRGGDDREYSDDLGSGEVCCVGGNCERIEPETECEASGAVCRSFGCDDSEEEADYSCTGEDYCCKEKIKKDYSLIWILAILIIFAAIGIIFREKLRLFWFRLKSKFRKSGSSEIGKRPPRPGFPAYARSNVRRPMPRRILPSSEKKPLQKRPALSKSNSSSEIDDVLRKLKEMGK